MHNYIFLGAYMYAVPQKLAVLWHHKDACNPVWALFSHQFCDICSTFAASWHSQHKLLWQKKGWRMPTTCGCYLARCCLFFSNFGLVPTIKFLNSEFCPLEKKIRSCAFWGCDESQFRSYASPPQDIHSLFAVEAAQLPSARCLKTLEEDNREMFLQMRRKMYFSCKRAARIFFSVFEISRGSFGHVGMGCFPGRHYLYGQTMVAVAAGSVGVWVALFKVHTCRRPNNKLKNIICFHSTGKRKKVHSVNQISYSALKNISNFFLRYFECKRNDRRNVPC